MAGTVAGHDGPPCIVLDEAGIVLMPVDTPQARIALATRIRFGRGMDHGGALNIGDTFAYALAKSHAAPLLYVGDDFSRTDIEAEPGVRRR
jgi:ribonuclease VapC